MAGRWSKSVLALFTLCALFGTAVVRMHAQQGVPVRPEVVAVTEPPPVPRGVDVLARGPIHEAFASLTADPAPTQSVPKRPPAPLEEMPPEEKPEGDVVWIGGYWAWDDDRNDFLWVSGIWRTPPPGKQWIAGYWRESDRGWQWVPGFWAVVRAEAKQEITYLPQPPAPPAMAPAGPPPAADTFYLPGSWVWNGTTYAWRAGYWARVHPGYVWVSSHYRWTPSGYIHIPGYWDLDIRRRGILFAPVVVNPVVVGPTFVYTPTYVVRDTVVVDALFVRPSHCHYYFGDYYGPAYQRRGFESCVVYSSRRYDSIIVYENYRHRNIRDWHQTQINLVVARNTGRAPVPPRTLVQQNKVIIQKNVTNVTNVTNVRNVNVQKTEVLTTMARVSQDRGIRTVPLNRDSRNQARQQSRAVTQVAAQRIRTETPTSGGPPSRPRTASLQMPRHQPIKAPPPRGAVPAQPAHGPVPRPAAVVPRQQPAVPNAPKPVSGTHGPPAAPHPGHPGGKPRVPGPGTHPPVPPKPTARPASRPPAPHRGKPAAPDKDKKKAKQRKH
jgi:WXXGXW repeat (2 copies)